MSGCSYLRVLPTPSIALARPFVTQVGLGCPVIADKGGADDDLENTWICVVEELWGFEDEAFGDMEEKMFSARWFWRAKDTVMKDMAARQPGVAFSMDPRRIFLERLRMSSITEDEYMNTGLDDSPVSCIVDKVNVLRRTPNDTGEVDASVDFFYDMSYDEEFCTFEDVNEYTPPPMAHPPVGAHLSGAWKPDAKRDMRVDGYVQLLVVFCLQKSIPGNFNMPEWPGLMEPNGLFAAVAPPPAATAAVTENGGGRGRRGSAAGAKPQNKKEANGARLQQVLTGFVRAALAHSPHAAKIKAILLGLRQGEPGGWDSSKQCFTAQVTPALLKKLGTELDAPLAVAREARLYSAAYGTPGYGEKGSLGASVSPPSTCVGGKGGGKQLLGLDLYAGAGGLSFMDGKRGAAELVTKWAVDIDPMAIQTFQVNNPKSVGFVHGTDEFLYLLKRWDELCTELEGFDADADDAKSAKRAKMGPGGKAPKKLLDVRPKPVVKKTEEQEEQEKSKSKKRKATKKKARDEDQDEDQDEEFCEPLCEEKLQFLVQWAGVRQGVRVTLWLLSLPSTSLCVRPSGAY